jgi:hypothetical protein
MIDPAAPTPEIPAEPAAEPGADAAAAIARIRSIVTAPEAVGCLALAVRIALDTRLAVPEALELLRAAVPAPPQPARTGRLN